MSKPVFKTLPPNCRIVGESPPARSSAKGGPPRAPTPPAPVTVAPPLEEATENPAVRRSKDKIAEDRRDPLLRPACAFTTWPGCNGMRMVCHGLSLEQAQGLLQAAQALGIPVQP